MFITDKISHGWNVLGTLLLGGALFAAAWGLSQAGQLDMAATGLSFFVMTMVRFTGPSLMKRAPEFAGTSALVNQARSDLANWLASRRLLSQCLIALALTLGFLAVRAVAAWALGIVASPWLALALGLGVAAIVAAPTILKVIGNNLGRGVEDTPKRAPQEFRPDEG